MTDRSLAIRLAVIDGGKVKAELRDVGDAGSRSLKRIEDAARPASRALLALDGVAGEMRGGLEAMSGRLGPLGAGLSRLGPAGLAAAAALAGFGIAVSKGIEEAAKADQSYRRLEAVLKATGYASGLTAKQIAAFSDGIERSTLATAEGVQDAASILATFRSVAGETFTRTLSLAQDMAAVFGQDLSSSATQLGKALEDPIQGINALRRVGISFSASQRELIATLYETGQTAEAQRLILDALERQVGGAGEAEASGLTGATNRLADAWGNLLEAIGKTPAITGVASVGLGALAGLIESLTASMEEAPIAERINQAAERLNRAREDLARIEAGGPGAAMLGQRFDSEEQRQRVAQLEGELAALQQLAAQEQAATAAAQERAAAGRAAAEAERRAELLAEQRRKLEEEQVKERKPADDAAKRMAEADAKAIATLARQLETFGDERKRAIDQALARLSEGATAQQRAEVQRLAGEIYDLGEAKKAEAEAERERQQIMREGARITEDARSPLARLSAEIQNLNRLQAAGAVTAATHFRAVADAIAEAEDKALAESTDWRAGLTRGMHDYADEALNAAEVAENAVSGAFEGMKKAMLAFAATGKIEFAAMVDAMLAELARLTLRMAVFAPLAKAAEGINWSSLFGGSAAYGTTGAGTSPAGMTSGGTNPGFLLGGVATGGAFAESRLLEAYARGGVFGGGIVDRPTVFPMARGYGLMGEAGPEAVMPLKRLASGKLGVEAAGGGVTVNIIDNAGVKITTEERREPGGGLTMDVVIDALEQQLAGRMVRPGTPLNGALRAAANPIRAR
jgi:lambda family phage tail tape measure protein